MGSRVPRRSARDALAVCRLAARGLGPKYQEFPAASALRSSIDLGNKANVEIQLLVVELRVSMKNYNLRLVGSCRVFNIAHIFQVCISYRKFSRGWEGFSSVL